MPLTSFLPWPLFAGGALAVWVAWLIQRRQPAPGARTLWWAVVMAGWWCVAGAFHALATSVDAKIVWAKIQYLGVASVPPLWLTFASQYAPAEWRARRGATVALWVLPVLTVVAAATNESHHAIWSRVEMLANGATVYGHGWFFWIDAAFNYLVVLAGAALLVRACRRSTPTFHSHWIRLIVAAVFPLAANLLYLTGITPPGLDLTPLGFTVSALLFTRAIYQDQLFDLIPVARDVVVESLSDAVVVLDSAKRLLDMNRAARRLAGDPATWVGQPVARVLPLLIGLELDAIESPVTLPRIDDGGSTEHFDVRVIHVRGRHEQAAAWVVVLRDISDQIRAEAERARLEARVQEQQRRESLSVLAGGLAHDFNNLLTGIVGNADLLSLQIPPSSELGHNVGAILLGAQRAADLVDKMLAYAGERHGSIERVNLDELIRDMVDLLGASVARHCTLRYEGQPATIDADPTQIRQVVMNLVINAADAVDERTGTITVTTGVETLTRADLAATDTASDAGPGSYAFLQVADNGTGMDDAMLARIFEPFFTTKATGHGLGLAAVQGIVHGHRGALRVKSEPGRGSIFRVWFPLAPSDQTPSRTRVANPSAPSLTSKS